MSSWENCNRESSTSKKRKGLIFWFFFFTCGGGYAKAALDPGTDGIWGNEVVGFLLLKPSKPIWPLVPPLFVPPPPVLPTPPNPLLPLKLLLLLPPKLLGSSIFGSSLPWEREKFILLSNYFMFTVIMASSNWSLLKE